MKCEKGFLGDAGIRSGCVRNRTPGGKMRGQDCGRNRRGDTPRHLFSQLSGCRHPYPHFDGMPSSQSTAVTECRHRGSGGGGCGEKCRDAVMTAGGGVGMPSSQTFGKWVPGCVGRRPDESGRPHTGTRNHPQPQLATLSLNRSEPADSTAHPAGESTASRTSATTAAWSLACTPPTGSSPANQMRDGFPIGLGRGHDTNR